MEPQTAITSLRPTDAEPSPKRALRELVTLVRDTFALWSHKRVGFSWRNYYWEHTHRVRSLCLALADGEQADRTLLEFAAVLHDITKRYDGPFLTNSEGKRLVDKRGLWISDTIAPDLGGNIVTALYDFYGESREPHSESGADIAHALVLLKGLGPGFARSVAHVVRAHIQPTNGDPREPLTIEQQILRDADLIDANFGLVAFYRNVQIHVHRRVQETGERDMRAYVEYVPNWLNSKFSFFDKMHVAEARCRAQARHQRCFDYHELMKQEVADAFDMNMRFGLLAVFDYFMSTIDNPDFFAELDHLAQTLVPSRRQEAESLGGAARTQAIAAVARAEQFCRELRQEAEGAT